MLQISSLVYMWLPTVQVAMLVVKNKSNALSRNPANFFFTLATNMADLSVGFNQEY